MMTLMSPKVWAALVVAAILAFAGFFLYRAGAASVRVQWDAEKLQQQQVAAAQETENRRLESKRQTNVIEAQNASTKRIQGLQVAAAGVRAESDGLRRDLDANTANLSRATPDACRKYAAAVNAVLGDLEKAGGGVAEKADGHASDSLTLQQAWPK